MPKLIFIGTLHCNFTPNEELEKIMLNQKPDLILVEIHQEDIENKKTETYPPEMQHALKVAKQNNIPVKGIDSRIIDYIEDREAEKEIIEQQRKIIDQHNWKDFNKEKYNKLLNQYSKTLTIQEKRDQRHQEMAGNIKNHLPKQGTVVILTGCGHITFFKKAFPEAEFPLSTS